MEQCAALLTARYGHDWRTQPVRAKARSSERDLDAAWIDLRGNGFPEAARSVLGDDLDEGVASELAISLFAPDGAPVVRIAPAVARLESLLRTADPTLGHQAGLDALVVTVAVADACLLEIHDDPDADPAALAEQWRGVMALAAAIIARTVAAAGSRLDQTFSGRDILGLQKFDQVLDPNGTPTGRRIRRSVDYQGDLHEAALTYLRWQQARRCGCRRGCHKRPHNLAGWVPEPLVVDEERQEGAVLNLETRRQDRQRPAGPGAPPRRGRASRREGRDRRPS